MKYSYQIGLDSEDIDALPSPSDVSTTQDVLMDIKKDLSDAEIEELGAQEAEKRGEK